MRKPLTIFVAVVVLALLAVGFVMMWNVKRGADDAQKESALRSLAVETADALDTYYQTNGSYPKSLQDLPTNYFRFHDGSSPAMLQQFRYSSDSHSYEFDWDSKWASRVSRTGSSAAVWVPLFPTNPPSK
jgi:type II secretory pathway pseudopilin PulG